MNIQFSLQLQICVSFLLLGMSQCVHAAEVSFTIVPSKSSAETVIEVSVEPDENPINAIEGVIGISERISGDPVNVLVETGGSAFPYWLKAPAYSEEGKAIRFTGGSYEPITKKESIFTIRIFSDEAREIVVSWLGGFAYQSDGRGTPEGISSRSLFVTLPENVADTTFVELHDSHPPEFDSLEVGQDSDMYEGKYFISFHAIDDTSGIARYEVIEGQEKTESIDGVYVLKDQERNSKIVVIAYDRAGNSSSIKFKTVHEWRYVIWIALGALMLIVFFIYIFKTKKFFRR